MVCCGFDILYGICGRNCKQAEQFSPLSPRVREAVQTMAADQLNLEAIGTAHLRWGNACESHTHQGIWRPRGAQVGGRADAYPGPWRGHRPGAWSICHLPAVITRTPGR